MFVSRPTEEQALRNIAGFERRMRRLSSSDLDAFDNWLYGCMLRDMFPGDIARRANLPRWIIDNGINKLDDKLWIQNYARR